MYCVKEDLYSSIGGLTEDNQKAPPTFLDDIIKRQSAHINSQISNRYVVPIDEATSPNSFDILKQICINLCRPLVAAKLDIAISQEDLNQSVPYMLLANQAEKRLRLIKDDKYDLYDAVECQSCDSFSSSSYNNCDADALRGIEINRQDTRRR